MKKAALSSTSALILLWAQRGVYGVRSAKMSEQDTITFTQYAKAIGVAWESSITDGVEQINAAIEIK